MRAARPPVATAVTAAVIFSLLLLPAHAAKARGRLQFTKPVALESFSPLRTIVGTVYSLQDGGEPSDHEWSGEPVLQIDKSGTIYIGGTCCVVAASPVWYSKNGKKFVEAESPGHVREWGIGAEGDLAVDDDGNVYFVDTYIPGLLVTKWSDHGETWEYTVPATGVVPGFDDRPWFAWSKKALYLYVNHVTHTAVYRSTDGGITWLSEGPLTWEGSAFGQPYFPGHIAADRTKGTLWVAGVNSVEGGNGLGSAVSTDGGQTFTEAVVTTPETGKTFSPIFTGTTAVDAAGNGYVTWSETNAEGCDVFYASSTNLGKSWSKPVKASSGPGCATFPWITADDRGEVALAWYQTPFRPKKAPTAAERFMSILTGRTSLYGGMTLALAPYQDEVPEDARWYLHAAMVSDAAGRKPVVTGARVPTKTPVLEGPLRRELWDFLQLDIGSDGRLHITYSEKFKDSAPQTWYVATKNGF